MKAHKKTLVAMALLLAAVLAFIVFASSVLTPKRYSYGCLWESYEKEAENSIDVMLLGSSIAYTDIIPAAVFEQSGMTSYSMAGPVQTMGESYYYLREATKTQTPQLVMQELSSLFLQQVDSYDLINIGSMPFSLNRFKAVMELVPKDQRVSYIFPMYAYHSRWSELGRDDFVRAVKGYDADPLAGYTCLYESTAFDGAVPKEVNYTKESFDAGAEYLHRIDDYCAENDIRLIVYLSPRCNYLDADADSMLNELVSTLNAEYIDFNEYSAEMGIDMATDFYDASHLNFSGAEKFSYYFAHYLTDALLLESAGNYDADIWQRRVEYYHGLAKS